MSDLVFRRGNAAAQRELHALTRLCCQTRLPRSWLFDYADGAMDCELCKPTDLLLENEQAYAQFERDSLSPGHVIVVPRRHIADFFQMSTSEHDAVNQLLREAHAYITERFAPDGFNVGINVGQAAGQNRMHVHVHLIPRYAGDVADPKGGVRAVLSKT